MADSYDIIAELRKKYEQSYGFALFDLTVAEEGDRIVLRGRVLTGKQKAEAIAAIAEASGSQVKDEVEVLSDPDGFQAGWATVKDPLIDLRSRFIPERVMNERIANRVRATQAAAGDVLRVLLEKDGQALVQTDDLALGWVPSGSLEKGGDLLRARWRVGPVVVPGEALSVAGSREDVIAAAERYLGVRYVLGAKSPAAIDCSGLTQAAYRRAFDIILPRHSWDQKQMGEAVELSAAATGDLAFLVNKKTGVKHVGILEISPLTKNIIHASLSQGGVLRQELGQVLSDYELAEVRRMIKK